jgi:hypothetical protein
MAFSDVDGPNGPYNDLFLKIGDTLGFVWKFLPKIDIHNNNDVLITIILFFGFNYLKIVLNYLHSIYSRCFVVSEIEHYSLNTNV